MAGLGDLYNRESMSLDAVPADGGIPVLPSPSTGEMTPVSNGSGLAAVYGRSNPARAREQRYASMIGMDMGGRLGQLPGVAAAIRAAIEGRKADAVDAANDAEKQKYMAQKEAWEKIKDNREQRDANARYLTETVFPAAQQAYMQVWNQSKDAAAASAKGTEVLNKMAADAGVPMPGVAGVNFWKGATSFAVRNEKGDITTAVFKDGALAVQNKEGKFEPPTERWMSVKDVADMMRASRGPSGANPQGMMEFYDANGNLVAKTKDQAEAIKNGAVYAGRWVKGMDDQGNETWQMERVPLSKAQLPRPAGDLNRQGAPASQAPAAAQEAAQQFGRPNPVPGSPGSGQQPARPPAAASTPASVPQGQMLRRKTPDGRIALYDQNRNFVRYE